MFYQMKKCVYVGVNGQVGYCVWWRIRMHIWEIPVYFLVFNWRSFFVETTTEKKIRILLRRVRVNITLRVGDFLGFFLSHTGVFFLA